MGLNRFLKVNKGWISVALCLILLSGYFVMDSSAEEMHEPAYDGYLIGMRTNNLMTLSAEEGLEHVADNIYHADDLADVSSLISQGAVEFVEPNYYLELLTDDNLSSYTTLNTAYQSGGAYTQMQVSNAVSQGYDGSGIRIAVIDNGLNLAFGDFDNAKVERYTVLSDGLLYDSGVSNPDHGTIVSDIIGGIHDNDIGVNGLASGATIVSIKVFDRSGCTILSLVNAINKAKNELNCQVINLSMGTETPSTTLEQAIQGALDAGIIVVAAAGNDGNSGNPLMYPASYDGVISVGAIGWDNTWQSYSCYNEYVDCTAPGTVVYKKLGDTSLYAGKGTSYASPAAAAAIALIAQANPGVTPAGADALLRSYCTDLGNSGRDIYYGYGFLSLNWQLVQNSVITQLSVSDSTLILTAVPITDNITSIVTALYDIDGRLIRVETLSPVSGTTYYFEYSNDTYLKQFYLDAAFSPMKESITHSGGS